MRRDDPPFNFDTPFYTSITYILLLLSKECNEVNRSLHSSILESLPSSIFVLFQ
jgi:hypothetical protein